MNKYTNLQIQLDNVIQKAIVYDELESHTNEAHNYCAKYLMPGAWGRNVWLEVLNDAYRMRRELEATKKSEQTNEG